MTNSKMFFSAALNNDDGSIIVPSLMVLAIISIIGVMAIKTSSDDILISTNQQLIERAFYAAESARAMGRNDPVLYGRNYIDPRILVGFPRTNASPQATPLPAPLTNLSYFGQMKKDTQDTITYLNSFTPVLIPGSHESIKGSVQYLGSSRCRGCGNDISFRAYNYKMVCEGLYAGRSNTTSRVEAGFFRIGKDK